MKVQRTERDEQKMALPYLHASGKVPDIRRLQSEENKQRHKHVRPFAGTETVQNGMRLI